MLLLSAAVRIVFVLCRCSVAVAPLHFVVVVRYSVALLIPCTLAAAL